jgi:hypothetical protein
VSENPIPYRYRESSFRRFESDIHYIVDKYPTIVIITPHGSYEAYTARCRDACRAYIKSDWQSGISRTRLAEIFTDISFAVTPTGVVVGPKATVRKLQTSLVNSINKTVESEGMRQVNISVLDKELLRAVCVCLDRGVIELTVILDGCNETIKKALEDQYPNLAIEQNGSDWFMV